MESGPSRLSESRFDQLAASLKIEQYDYQASLPAITLQVSCVQPSMGLPLGSWSSCQGIARQVDFSLTELICVFKRGSQTDLPSAEGIGTSSKE